MTIEEVKLGLTKNPGESWRDAAERYARKHGLEHEVLELFDQDVSAGGDPAHAAWSALYEWDILEIVAEGEEV